MPRNSSLQGVLFGGLCFLAATVVVVLPAEAEHGGEHLVQFEPTEEFFLNPERGVYKALDLFEDPSGSTLLQKCQLARAQGYSIVYTSAILPRTGTLPVDRITDGFNAIRTCGAKAIVRFYYMRDDHVDECKVAGSPCVDPPLETILEHIESLKAPLQENSDVIMAVQAGLVGPWGEWHSSTLSEPPNYDALRQVLLALLDAVPADRMVQVRNPRHRHAIFSTPLGEEAVEKENALGMPGGDPQPPEASRTGHHNDCFLSSLTDRGTYSSEPEERSNERFYISLNTRSTPMGGETCNLHEEYTPTDEELRARAIEELPEMHWTYLHGGYSESVRYRLGARDSMAQNEQPGYDHEDYRVYTPSHEQPWRDILNKLGYRFVISFADITLLSFPVGPGGRFIFSGQIENVGYASMFNRRPVYLVLHNAANSYKFKLPDDAGGDPRRWDSGPSIFMMAFEIPENAVPGVYTVSMWLPDESPTLQNRPEYAVRFAHDSALWDAEMGYNILKVNGFEIADS